MRIDLPALPEEFGQNPADTINDGLLNEAQHLIIAVYRTSADDFEDPDLGKLRAYKFLNNKSLLLTSTSD